MTHFISDDTFYHFAAEVTLKIMQNIPTHYNKNLLI